MPTDRLARALARLVAREAACYERLAGDAKCNTPITPASLADYRKLRRRADEAAADLSAALQAAVPPVARAALCLLDAHRACVSDIRPWLKRARQALANEAARG